MAVTQKIIVLSLAASLMAGCTTVKRMTGQIDDTKLPGAREDVLSPAQQQARDPAITGQPEPISQMPVSPPPGTATTLPQQQVANAQPADPATTCNPKIDLCPEPLPPEPLPPNSPVAKTKAKVADASTAKPVKKKIIKKKKAATATDAPSAPKAPASVPDGAVPAPPKPQGQ